MIYAIGEVEGYGLLKVSLIVVDAEEVTESIGEIIDGQTWDGTPVRVWVPQQINENTRTLIQMAMRGLTETTRFLRIEGSQQHAGSA